MSFDRSRATPRTSTAYGIVRQRRWDLQGADFSLEIARHCRTVPTAEHASEVVLEPAAVEAGCRLGLYRGPVTLTLRGTMPTNATERVVLQTDRDGRLIVPLSELDDMLRQRHRALAEFTHLEVGLNAWAGTYELTRLRTIIANYYLKWALGGRGTPGLFVARYPDHPLTLNISDVVARKPK